jgi:3D (Asp-Asp-Asp) domain-containing protein
MPSAPSVRARRARSSMGSSLLVWTMVVTAYVRTCEGCTGVVASGIERDPRALVVAASEHWPFGTCLEAVIDQRWQRLVVEDRGSAIDRRDELDLMVPTVRAARAWGRQSIPVRYCQLSSHR